MYQGRRGQGPLPDLKMLPGLENKQVVGLQKCETETKTLSQTHPLFEHALASLLSPPGMPGCVAGLETF